MRLNFLPCVEKSFIFVLFLIGNVVGQEIKPVVRLSFEQGLQAVEPKVELAAQSTGIDFQKGPKGISVFLGEADELYYEFKHPQILDEGALTFWVSPDWLVNDRCSHIFAGFADPAENTTAYIWKPSFEAPQLVVTFPEQPINQQNRIWRVIDWTKGSWHHIAFTWSKKQNRLALYCDGQQVQMDQQQRSSRYISFGMIKYLVIGERMENGRCQHGSGLNGRTADIRIYDVCLTDSQVRLIQQSAVPGSGTIPVLPRQRSSAQVSMISSEPVIDGKLSDPCWKSATPLDGFDSPRTRGWIAGDSKGLYVALDIAVEEGETLVAKKRLENDPQSMNDDSLVEIDLSTLGMNKSPEKYVINPRGVIGRLDAHGMIAHDLTWKCRTELKDKGFTVEIAIPFHSLGITDRTGFQWGLNIKRRVKSQQRPDRCICWSPMSANLAPTGLLIVPQMADAHFKKQFYQPEPLDRSLIFRNKRIDCWIESNLRRVTTQDRVLPDKKAAGTAALQVELARNEYEACQLVVCPFENVKKVHWKVSDLRGQAGQVISAKNIDVCRVGYVNGQFADVLIPGNDFPLKAQQARSLWITVYIPADSVHGDYESTLALDLDGQKITCPLKVTVWNYDIPFEQNIITPFFSFWEGTLTPYNHKFGKSADNSSFAGGIYVTPEWDKFMEGIFDMLAKHRLNHNDPTPNSFYYGYVGAMKWEPTGAEVTTRFERWARFWRARGRYIGQITYPYNVQSEKEFNEHRERMKKFYRYWHRLLEKNGWLTYCYATAPIDEPPFPNRMLMEWAKLVKENAPGLRRQIWTGGHGLDVKESANLHAWIGSIDGWGLTARDFDQQAYLDFARDRQKEGEKIYWYIHPYCDLNADPALTRSFFWNMARCNIDGCLYYSINYFWGKNTKRNGDDFQIDSGTTGYQLGDGHLVWPGPDNIYGSLRLASIRDGLEDYESYRLLGRLARQLKIRLDNHQIPKNQIKSAERLYQTANSAMNLPTRMNCSSQSVLSDENQIPSARREIARNLEQFVASGWDNSTK
jgi:hypothetical protein